MHTAAQREIAALRRAVGATQWQIFLPFRIEKYKIRTKNRRHIMAILNCGAVDCSYNKDKCCCKGDIMVGGKHACECDGTCCESFHKRNGDSFTSAISHPSSTISIDCEATKCMYNADYRCQAEHVDIKGSNAGTSRDTICATFREK